MATNDDWERSMLEADEHAAKPLKRPINDSSAIAGHSGVDFKKAENGQKTANGRAKPVSTA